MAQRFQIVDHGFAVDRFGKKSAVAGNGQITVKGEKVGVGVYRVPNARRLSVQDTEMAVGAPVDGEPVTQFFLHHFRVEQRVGQRSQRDVPKPGDVAAPLRILAHPRLFKDRRIIPFDLKQAGDREVIKLAQLLVVRLEDRQGAGVSFIARCKNILPPFFPIALGRLKGAFKGRSPSPVPFFAPLRPTELTAMAMETFCVEWGGKQEVPLDL